MSDNELVLATIQATGITDWHVSLGEPRAAVVFPGMRAVPESLHVFADGLAAQIRIALELSTNVNKSFILRFCGLSYRAHQISSSKFALRLTRKDVPVLGRDVKFREDIHREVLSTELKRAGGLIVISGVPGCGKSWSSAAILSARLREMGGYALTIEDPIEIEALEGWHKGKAEGFCEQMEVPSRGEGGYAQAMANSLRCFPAGERAMLFVGEVREGEAAAEVLRIAMAGHLVVTTVHAQNHARSMERMVSLATQGGEPNAATMLANALQLSIHQRLENGSMSATMLKVNQTIRSCIEDNKYGAMATVIDQQNPVTAPRSMPQKTGFSAPCDASGFNPR